MMPTPSYLDWTTVTSANRSLRPQSIRERHLAVLATLVSGRNPDGTPRSPSSGNILTAAQSGFEDGSTGGWIAQNGTLANVASPVHNGSRALQFTGNGGGFSGNITQTIPFTGSYGVGSTFTLSGWANPSTTARRVTAGILFYSSGVPFLPTLTGPSVFETLNIWSFVPPVISTAPATADSISIYMICSGGNANGEIRTFDDIVLTFI